MRSFFILNARAVSPKFPGTPASAGSYPLTSSQRALARERLRFRDMVWAFHSESQEILLSVSTSACGGKMKWPDAKALGVFLWLNSVDSMVRYSPMSMIPLLSTVVRKPSWRRLRETSSCRARTETQQLALYFTSLLVK